MVIFSFSLSLTAIHISLYLQLPPITYDLTREVSATLDVLKQLMGMNNFGT